ncbi:MAG: glutaredoxin [Lachnospiraceae bacterium]|nr:glutaredoxin [Lachnospiraceae bacterium]
MSGKHIRRYGTRKNRLKCRDKDLLALIKYTTDEDKDEKILENQKVLKTPVVRNGKQATAGYQPDIWKKWR